MTAGRRPDPTGRLEVAGLLCVALPWGRPGAVPLHCAPSPCPWASLSSSGPAVSAKARGPQDVGGVCAGAQNAVS